MVPFSAASSTTPSPYIDLPNTLIKKERQLTFMGPRSGEGYFSADGQQMIFQSEREPGNPFFQMYRMDLKTGKTTRLSPGYGKTTCGWFHPQGKMVLFSSTHLDPLAKQKQSEEFELRKKPVKAKYSWSFDEEYDIFSSDLNGRHLKALTHERGYDAEGSYSNDGRWIAFASNRSGFIEKLSEEDQKIFSKDQSYMMDIYIMKADGSGVRQLTTERGYDGGPFFSADSKKIVWRHFNSTGTMAEIWTMNVDGSDKKQITKMGVMSWAPFFHPSGDYIIYATSALGFHNFELFIVDSEGKKDPVRVTNIEGFDGLSSFSPDGHQVTWAHRNEKGDSQIYIADWDDGQARRLLGLAPPLPQIASLKSGPEIQEDNIQKWVDYLASPQFLGRRSGSPEEKIYSQKIADYFQSLGLQGAAHDGSFFDKFEFTSAVKLGSKNTAELVGGVKKTLRIQEEFQPLSLSRTGEFKEAPIVFVGYGIKANANDKEAAYDSYRDLDVQGKWVLALKDLPQDINKDRKLYLQYFSHLQYKVRVAKNAGALGVMLVDSEVLRSKDPTLEKSFTTLQLDGAKSDLDLGVISIKANVAQELLKKAGKEVVPLLDKLDKGEQVEGFLIPSTYFRASLDLEFEKSEGINVVARWNTQSISPKNKGRQLVKKGTPPVSTVIVGAHGDHLGRGEVGNSLARGEEKGQVHTGADDNASGVAGVLELARVFAVMAKKNPHQLKKNLVFAIWSGEEIGVLGSTHFAKKLDLGKGDKNSDEKVEAYINLDMVGRLRDRLFVQGAGSGDYWPPLAEKMGLKYPSTALQLLEDPYVPTDSMAFYMVGVPTLGFFTGVHEDYHSPRDSAEKINLPGEVRVVTIVKEVLLDLTSTAKNLVHYQKVEGQKNKSLEGRSFRIYLGSIPDYGTEGIKGVKVSGTTKGSPAEKAGLLGGDIIIELDGQKIENIYDYVFSLQTMKAGQETLLKVSRQNDLIELKIIPQLKE